MEKRTLLLVVTVSLIVLSGCATGTQIGTRDEEYDQPVRSDLGVQVIDLRVISDGVNDCRHTYLGDVKNTKNKTIYNVTVQMTILDSDGGTLSKITTTYKEIPPGGIHSLNIERVYEGSDCWNEQKASNFTVNATFSTAK